ncbi:hypothetical protein RM704_07410 [Streptomyces sp. DSM 3412]|uniref:Uncharacterized protein n=1 Tax=Streptomyces gottesmaniae TaxID=3075518 RepID=A0ABU2YSJ6_9ACTN|nr:hypothetical protein [Streptomyces sp. DSM 3412]MDT0567290.1 hypothetical protein [Streptomyces sp. DSM 3412]
MTAIPHGRCLRVRRQGKSTEIYHVEELLKLTQQISGGVQPA